MSDYTPRTGEVRTSYFVASTLDCSRNVGEVQAEFDRWLAGVQAAAWEEGRIAEAESWAHIWDGHPVPEGETCVECVERLRNPYGEEE